MAPLRVSICINNHNYGRFVGEAIDSALAQTYEHVEVVVVDDGSTDDSAGVIGRYGDRVLAVLRPNGGQASAINAGVAASSGDIVMLLDADDVLLPDIAAKVAQAFSADPDLVKVQFHLRAVDADRRELGWIKPPLRVPMPSGDLREDALRFRTYIWPPTSGNAFRRRALDLVLPVPEDEYRTSADLYLADTVVLVGRVLSLAEVGALYRVHGSNAYASRRRGLDFFHSKIEGIVAGHEHVKKICAALDIRGCPPKATDALDVAFASYRLSSLRLDPSAHPIPGDRRFTLLAHGVRSALAHPQHPWPHKLKRAAWLVALGLAPRPLVPTVIGAFYKPSEV